MSGFLCSMVGVSSVAAAAEIIRYKKSVIASANAQVDTAQSKFGGASALFDGTGDALTIEHNGNMRFGTGDFTIEFWYRPNAKSQSYPIVLTNKNGFSAGNIVFHDRHDSYNTKLTVWIYNLSNSVPQFTATTSTVNGTWYHIALSRSGTSLKFFVNGTQEGSTVTTSANLDTGATTEPYYISYPGSSSEFNGWVDEVRVSNTARYTGNFTAPTTAFTNDNSTLLLLHMNGTDASTYFEDDNGIRASNSIVASGNAQIDTAQSKFGGTSALFDGTGDYLNVGETSDFAFGTGNFTVECWIRNSKSSSTRKSGIISKRNYDNINSGGWGIYLTTDDGKIGWEQLFSGGASYEISTTISANTWYHMAVVRSGTSMNIYIDGTSRASWTDSTNYTNTNPLKIGTFWDSTQNNTPTDSVAWQGWIDEVRISNTARYTTTFTPSTTPFVNDTNTLLLAHMDGTDAVQVFIDDNGTGRSAKGISTNGNAQVDTAQSKFGGSSALFDGTGDYLTVGNTVDNDLALTGNYWTVEYWARINAHAGAYQATVCIWNDSSPTGSVYYFSTNMYNGTNKMGFEYNYGTTSGSGAITFGSVLSTGVWKHHAFVRDGNTLTAYLDGVSQGTHDMTGRTIDITGYNSSTNTSLKMTIGAMSGGGGAYNGWLDEIRISNTARYTANFTPSTTQFSNDSNTILLIHCDGTDAATVFIDDNGQVPQTP